MRMKLLFALLVGLGSHAGFAQQKPDTLSQWIAQDRLELVKRHMGDPATAYPLDGRDGVVPLIIAVRSHALQTARWLLAHGATVNAADAMGVTALHLCAELDENDGTFTRLLLGHGANLRQKASDGYDALDTALERRNRLFVRIAMRELLLQSSENPAQRAGFLAALEGGDLPTPQATPEQSVLLLNVAVSNGSLGVLNAALAAGAQPDAHNRSGHSPLSLAAGWGEEAMLQTLLAHGSRVDLQNHNRYQTSALMESSRDGHLANAQILLAHGANVNLLDVHQDHALNWATYFGHTDFVDLLLAHGANVAQVGQQSYDNAMDIAIRRQHPDIISRLARAGAKPSK